MKGKLHNYTGLNPNMGADLLSQGQEKWLVLHPLQVQVGVRVQDLQALEQLVIQALNEADKVTPNLRINMECPRQLRGPVHVTSVTGTALFAMPSMQSWQRQQAAFRPCPCTDQVQLLYCLACCSCRSEMTRLMINMCNQCAGQDCWA